MDEMFEGISWEEVREQVKDKLDSRSLRRLEALYRLHEELQGEKLPEEVVSALARLREEFPDLA